MENRQAILTEEINLTGTKGIYTWYCKNIVKLYCVVIAILNQAKKVYAAAEYTILVNSLWIVNHMSNKLEGICSISSSVHDNCFCKARQAIKDCICKHCVYGRIQ